MNDKQLDRDVNMKSEICCKPVYMEDSHQSGNDVVLAFDDDILVEC